MEPTRNAAVSGTTRAAGHSAQDQQGLPDNDSSQSDARRAGKRLAGARFGLTSLRPGSQLNVLRKFTSTFYIGAEYAKVRYRI